MTYMYPFPRATRVSQAFGSGRNQGANGPGGHTGIDYAVPVGTPVRAAADGVIELSSWVSENYADNPWWLTQMGGDNIVLNCGGSKPTFIYAHLSDSLIEVGQHVYKGQIIAYSGNTGTATTGPHTHVEALPPGYVLNSSTYGRIDPNHYFDEYYEASLNYSGTITPTVETIKESIAMGKIVYATDGKSAQVWRGDGNTRTRVDDMAVVKGAKYMAEIGALDIFHGGKDYALEGEQGAGMIQQVWNLDIIGTPVK